MKRLQAVRLYGMGERVETIQQEQGNGELSVEALCEVLEVAPSGYYAWREREVSPRQKARMALFDYIEAFYNRQRLHSGIGYARPVSRAA